MNNKYEFMQQNNFFSESRHIRVQQDFCDALWSALLKSPYTKGELAERLGWDLHRLMMVLTGDDTVDFYDAVHVAGALGYRLEVSIKEKRGDYE